MNNLIDSEQTGDLPDGTLPVENWSDLSAEEQASLFSSLPISDASTLFYSLDAFGKTNLLLTLPADSKKLWLRQLAPDDIADVIQAAPADDRISLFSLLDPVSSVEVSALLAYDEDNAGGLMSPRYARIRPDMSVDEAISYLKRQTRNQIEDVYYLYVLDSEQHLLGVVAFRDLFGADPKKIVRDIMIKDPVRVFDTMDQESVSKVLADYHLLAVPVVDTEGRMQGIVSIKDVVDVVKEEATEDIQKMGGTEVLDAPYLATSIRAMIRKRGSWLAVLFIGELLTAAVMSHYEQDIAKAVMLTLFIPLIISSGGNSGSQASTLVIRALALGELRSRDWWRVFRRELGIGVSLGSILALLGLVKIALWPSLVGNHSQHSLLIGAVVGLSLVGVVTYGAVIGAILPILLRKLGFDPASASAPMVATLVDVTGLAIYFSIAQAILGGVLL